MNGKNDQGGAGDFEIELVDTQTGKLTVYRRLEDMPPDLRAKVEPFLAKNADAASIAPVTFRDASGDQVGFSSEQEMPDEIRKMVGKARRGNEGNPVSGHKVVIWKTRRPERLAGRSGNHNSSTLFYFAVLAAVAVAGMLAAWLLRKH